MSIETESRVVPGTSDAIIAFLAEQAVHQRRLADIRAADEGDADAVGVAVEFDCAARFRQTLLDVDQQLVQSDPVRGRNRDDIAEAVAGEFGHRGARIQAIGLVDHEHRRPCGLAQPLQDVVVQRRRAFAAIDHEQDEIGFFRCRPGLARGGAGEAFIHAGDAAGIDHGEVTLAFRPAHAVVAVAGHARLVVHQRVTSTRQRIEQRRLADIGAAHQGDEGKHGNLPIKGPGRGTNRTGPQSGTRKQ
jgi:hypothetical protein